MIARTVVDEQLAACANRGAPIQSSYRWEGRLEQNEEYPLLIKTLPDRFPLLRERIKALHSYTTPVIVAWETTEVDPDYLNWVRQNVEGGA